MKQISKITQPNLLVQHKANQPAYYAGLSSQAKEELTQSLLSEQGHICCYCMKRIPEKVEKDGRVIYEMKVEHFQCQANFPQLQLTYSNLFAACTGNEGKPKKLQTCDTQKGDLELSIDITSNAPNCEALFKYNSEGEISSITDDDSINQQLNKVLNLNMQTLKEGRSEVFLEVQKKVEAESKKCIGKSLKIGYFEQERVKWLTKTGNKYKQFCMVAVYYLNKKIHQYE